MKITGSFIDSLGPSAIRAVTMKIDAKAAEGIPVTSFAGGKPAPELFPVEDLRRLTDKIFDEEGGQCIQYAPSSGYGKLRVTLAEFMKRFQVNDAKPENILPFSGSAQALNSICRALVTAEDTVLVEAPCYTGSLDIFRSYTHNVVGIPMEEDGMDLDAVESILKERPVRLIYVIPDFQNPSARVMSLEKRRRLVALAQQYNTLVLEDAPYSLLGFDGTVMPAVKSFDTQDNVVYMGSVSKIIAPGLRVGWIVGPADFVQKMVYVKMIDDLQVNNIAKRQVDRFFTECDFDAHLSRIRETYRVRSAKMVEGIRASFPEGCTVVEPKGGMFLWVELPQEMDAMEMFDYVFEQNIAYVPGSFFYPDGSGRNTIRLNFSTSSLEDISEKIPEMGRLICAYAAQHRR